jgi:hypothetical protein
MVENILDNKSQGNTVLSAEGIFIDHYFRAMEKLQSSWMGSEIDSKKFGMQIEYLIRLLPDYQTQTATREKFDKELDNYEPDDKQRQYKAGLSIITELVRFVCTSFDLLHVDIVGPSTSEQFVPLSPENLPEFKGVPKDAKQ